MGKLCTLSKKGTQRLSQFLCNFKFGDETTITPLNLCSPLKVKRRPAGPNGFSISSDNWICERPEIPGTPYALEGKEVIVKENFRSEGHFPRVVEDLE